MNIPRLSRQTWAAATALALLLSSLPPTIFGQTAPATDPAQTKDTPFVLSDFVVTAARDNSYGATTAFTATRIGIPIIKTPLNVQVISGQLLQDQGVRDYQGALKFVSGVSGDSLNIDAGSLNIGGAGSFTIRGFVPSLFLRNGFRRPANLLSENVERIEVIKGPASVFFGQAAPGGLINVISRKPSSTQSASIDYTFGSYGFNKVRADATGPLGKTGVNYRLFTAYEDSDDWRDFVYTKNMVIAPSLTWSPTSRLSFTLDYEHVDRQNNFPPYTAIGNKQFIADYENPPAAAQTLLNLTPAELQARWRNAINTWINDRRAFSGVQPFRITDYIVDISPRGHKYNSGGPDQIYDQTTDNLTLESTFSLNDNISFRYGGNYFELDSYTLRSALAVTNADRTINLALESPRQTDKWMMHQFDTLFTFDLPVVKNKIVLGYQFTRNRSIVLTPAFNFAGAPGGAASVQLHNAYTMPPIRLSQIPFTLPTPAADANLRNYTKGYAASWFGEWFDSGRLTTLIGVRREQDQRKRLGLPVLADLDRTATTPTFGGTFRILDGVSLFASYSENFAPNSVRTRTGGGLLPSDNAADLPVEVGKGKDIGIKTNWKDNRLSGSLSFYEIERSSVPRADTAGEVADPRNVNGLTTPGSVRYNVAGGIDRSRGVELDFVYSPIRQYQMIVAAGWMWEAKVIADPSALPGTITYERVFNQGRRLRNAPEYTFAFWNKYDFTTGAAKGLSLGLGVRYVSEIQPRPADTTSLLFNPSFTVVSALVSYRTKLLGRATTFSLNADNLFDKLYFEGNTGVSDPLKIFLKTSVAF